MSFFLVACDWRRFLCWPLHQLRACINHIRRICLVNSSPLQFWKKKMYLEFRRFRWECFFIPSWRWILMLFTSFQHIQTPWVGNYCERIQLQTSSLLHPQWHERCTFTKGKSCMFSTEGSQLSILLMQVQWPYITAGPPDTAKAQCLL